MLDSSRRGETLCTQELESWLILFLSSKTLFFVCLSNLNFFFAFRIINNLGSFRWIIARWMYMEYEARRMRPPASSRYFQLFILANASGRGEKKRMENRREKYVENLRTLVVSLTMIYLTLSFSHYHLPTNQSQIIIARIINNTRNFIRLIYLFSSGYLECLVQRWQGGGNTWGFCVLCRKNRFNSRSHRRIFKCWGILGSRNGARSYESFQ